MDSQGYLQPSVPDAERTVLAALLRGDLRLTNFENEDFGGAAHRHIVQALRDLRKSSNTADIAALQSALTSKGTLAGVGGAEYMQELALLSCDEEALLKHVEALREKARVRKLIGAAERIIERGRGDYGNLDAYLHSSVGELHQIVNEVPPAGLQHGAHVVLRSFQDISTKARSGRRVAGIPTGFRRLDALTSGMHPGDLVVLAARPGMGKTSLALNIAMNAAHSQRQDRGDCSAVLIFSLENDAETMLKRILASEARVNSSRMQSGQLSREDWPQLAQAAGMVSDLPIFVDDTERLTIAEIWSRAENMKDRGLGLVVIDYVQLIRTQVRGETREREATEVSRSLKQLARYLRVPVIAISQLNRGPEGRQTRQHRPQPSDLRDTGALEEDADLLLFVYRDEVYNRETLDQGIAEIIVAKQRRGPTGTCKVRFFNQYSRFDDLAEEDDAPYLGMHDS